MSGAELFSIITAGLAVLFIGISKAGFGGGLGMLVTPLCVLAFGRDAVGILLPLLALGDAFSLYHYWGRWRKDNLKYLLPGVTVGVLIGAPLVGQFSPQQLNVAIGILAVSFVIWALIRDQVLEHTRPFVPGHTLGIPCGIGIGITSTFAHAAGPLGAIWLIPQRLPKDVFVGTTVLIFTWVNWIKFPFFVGNGLITPTTLLYSLKFALLVPFGVWIGVALHRSIPERLFARCIYGLTFLTGLELIFGLGNRLVS